jgi:alanine racemase
VLAVVKAGGYGHGAVPVAKAALDAGAWGLAVATLEEAAELKGLARSGRILVMGGLTPGEARTAIELGCAVGCSSLEMARALESASDHRSPLPVHLKIDTGMGRFGCPPSLAPELARYIDGAPGLHLEGTWTHFHSSESDEDATRRQFGLFMETLDELGVEPGLRHACNSAAALKHPEMALDAVRAGIALYGCEHPELQPVMAVRALVTHLKEVPSGATVGYGATWTASTGTRVATASIGYADGVARSRSNKGWALVRGRRAPLIGRVSMDAITLDVSEIDELRLGDVVTLIGADGDERITAEEVAAWSGTISYEVLTSVGPRLARRYLE